MKKIFSIHTPLCSDDNKTLHTHLCWPIFFQPDRRHQSIYKRKRKKRTGFARGGSHLACLLHGNNLIKVPGVIFQHAGSGT